MIKFSQWNKSRGYELQREPSGAEKTVCAPTAVPTIQSEQARDEICLSANEIRGANEICLAADEVHQGWMSFGSLNRNELNARVEPCGTFQSSPRRQDDLSLEWDFLFAG